MSFATIPLTLFIGAILFFFYACLVSTQAWYFDDNDDQVTADGKKIPYRITTTLVEYGTPNRNMDIFKWDKDES